MANNPKSTNKSAKKAGTTSSGSRNAGARGTSSRRRASSQNASNQGVQEEENYNDNYRDARYRGMSNEGEEGDLSNQGREQRFTSYDDEDYGGRRTSRSQNRPSQREYDQYDDDMRGNGNRQRYS